jgi:hypothetical protein
MYEKLNVKMSGVVEPLYSPWDTYDTRILAVDFPEDATAMLS